MTSASESLATVMPESPASNCPLAMPGILCVFTWGLSATPLSLATWAIFCKFLSIFGPSTRRYGVPEDLGIGNWELGIGRLLGMISQFEIHTSQFKMLTSCASFSGEGLSQREDLPTLGVSPIARNITEVFFLWILAPSSWPSSALSTTGSKGVASAS